MMQPGDGFPTGHPAIPPQAHLPMDLHMGQGFQYYRYGYGGTQDYHLSPTGKPGCEDMMQGGIAPRLHWYPDMMQPNQTGIQEVRKEKSRDAARSRRGKENYEFYELAKMLPLPGAITSQLDKASIIRLTISYLKIGEFSSQGDPPWNRTSNNNKLKSTQLRSRGVPPAVMDVYDRHQGTHVLQSMDGFPFTLGIDGRFLYVSETVSMYLGLSQVEMCGSSIFDYIHPQDHSEFAEQTGLLLSNGRPLASPGEETTGPVGTHNADVNASMTMDSNSEYQGLDRSLCVRMKSTLTKRGCHFKTPGYRVLLLQCRLRPQYSFSQSQKSMTGLLGMSGLAIAMPPPNINDIRLDSDMFVTRVSFELRIVHCEPRVSELLDFTPDDLSGRSLYTLCHGADVSMLRKAHQDLLQKGQVLTQYYRFLSKNGGFVWVQSCLIMVCNNKNSDEQIIICINYIISMPEHEGVSMDVSQLPDYANIKTEDLSERRVEDREPRELVTSKPAVIISSKERSPQSADSSESRDSPIRRSLTVGISKPETPRRPGKRKQMMDESRIVESRLEEEPRCAGRTSEESATSSGSVKDLESAMSKHLPPQHEPTDFSTDTLLRGPPTSQRPAIQWVGGHPAASAAAGGGASSLLRQLYGGRPGVPTAAGRYAAEFLPTPPGADGYPEQFYSLPGSYMEAAAAAAAGYDYHSMTPPSSVSPRDKPGSQQLPTAVEYTPAATGGPGTFRGHPGSFLTGLDQTHFPGDRSSLLYPDPGRLQQLCHPRTAADYEPIKPHSWCSPPS